MAEQKLDHIKRGSRKRTREQAIEVHAEYAKLSPKRKHMEVEVHLQPKPNVKVDQESAEQVLTESDIGPLMALVHKFSDKWHDIGLELGFTPSELNQISSNPSLIMSAPASFLKRLLSQWVQWPTVDHPTKPTLGTLCGTLRSSLVGLGTLAKEVEREMKCSTTDVKSTGMASKRKLHEATCSEQVTFKKVEDCELITNKEENDMTTVEISGEKYYLDVVPAAGSKVVAEEKEKLLGAVDLNTLVRDLGLAGAFIRIAYNGVMASGPRYTELQIEIQQLGFDITKLCDESALTVSKFKTASSTVLIQLEATYEYLLLNLEDVAIETLSSVSKLAGDMEKAALVLHEKFEKEEKKVEKTLKRTQTARGEAAIHVEEKEKEHQQLQLQLRHQQQLLEDTQRLEREAEVQRQQMEIKEDEAISGIKHIGTLKSLVNAIFRYEVFDEGRKKVSMWKEKRIEALENENKLRRQRYEAMEKMTSFAVTIKNCQSEQELAKMAEDALHKTVGALKELTAAIMRAATFWRQMQEHCRSLANDGTKAKVKTIKDSVTKEERMKVWTSKPFKKQAVYFYARWVALNSVCSEYVEHIKKTQKDLYEYIVKNPTYEESRKNVHELAKKFLTDLKKDQETIAKKEFEAKKEINALRLKQD